MNFIKEYFLFQGVTGRKKFAFQNIGLLVAFILAVALGTAIDGENGDTIIMTAMLLSIWSLLSISVNRIRDTKLSTGRAVFYFLFLTPFLYAWLFFRKTASQAEIAK